MNQQSLSHRLAALLALALLAAACSGSSSDTMATTTDPTAKTTTTTTTTTTALNETTAVATITGTALPRFGTTPDPAIGLAAPTLEGTSFDGSAVSIGPSDTYTVAIFFAHWCPHCQDEVKNLGPYFEATPPAPNTEVVAVSTGVDPQRPNYPPSEWLTSEAWPYRVIADTADHAMANAYGLNAYPFWVVLNPDGTVLARTAGSLPPESVDALFQNLSQLEG